MSTLMILMARGEEQRIAAWFDWKRTFRHDGWEYIAIWSFGEDGDDEGRWRWKKNPDPAPKTPSPVGSGV
jgi:hypothetical protein